MRKGCSVATTTKFDIPFSRALKCMSERAASAMGCVCTAEGTVVVCGYYDSISSGKFWWFCLLSRKPFRVI